jgi:ADP-heptose:LPS heptosyltransferase
MDEAEYCDRIALIHRGDLIAVGTPAALKSSSMREGVVEVVCQRPFEAMALIERCRFFVTNDSGLMHIAAALNVPMVAIFGSTDPVATGPRSRKARVIRHPMECSPCLKPECPRDYRCLRAIQPGEVWKEMESLRSEEK